MSLKPRTFFTGALFIFGFLLILISFIIAGVMVSQASGRHFSFSTPSNGAHGITSLVAFIGITVFVVMRIFVDSSLRSAKVEKLQDDPSSDTAQFYRLGSYSSWAILALTILV